MFTPPRATCFPAEGQPGSGAGLQVTLPSRPAVQLWEPWGTCGGKLSVAQSCPNLWDPVDCSRPGSSVHGVLQAGTLEGVTVPVSRGPSPPRDLTRVSCIGGSAGKEPTCKAGDLRLIPGSGSSPGGGHGNPPQYSDLENPTGCVVHGIAKSRTPLNDFHILFLYHVSPKGSPGAPGPSKTGHHQHPQPDGLKPGPQSTREVSLHSAGQQASQGVLSWR